MTGRGGGWVVAQFALMALAFAAALVPPDWPDSTRGALSAIGALIALGGGILAVVAGRSLGRGLTPFPRPVDGAPLADRGPYSIVRHPIYTGGLLFFLGWSLYAGPVALAVTVALAALWVGKIAVEERHLRAAYPGYADYAARVRWRLFPGAL